MTRCEAVRQRQGFVSVESAEQRAPPRRSPKGARPTRAKGDARSMSNIEQVRGTGRTIHRVTKTALCRCGHSANKPYCDGTHSKIGFTTE